MKELKAVEILLLMQRVDDVSTRQMQKEINEALAELLETQARLDNLRDYCNSAYMSYPGGYKFALGYIQARKDILTKLEQGSKEQRRK